MRDQTITAWNLLSISDPVEHVSFYFLLNLHRRSLTGSKLLNTPPKKLNLTSTSKTWIWTRNLDPGPEKPGLILRPGPRPWSETLKNLNPEKHGINMRLKNTADLRALYSIKTNCNLIWISSFTNRYRNFSR